MGVKVLLGSEETDSSKWNVNGEIIMHLLLFNIRLKQFYNPGLVTGLFGIGTVVVIYLIRLAEAF